ncbi:MAG: SDR family NAD(P)-dependent oxidoreductase [Bacteroidales bacterium]|jgi:3-oxoacyl-[acyl-carrier-protein] synthase-3|nr:SDR family NAD(P)-dependent oxidoreductase [Bacteroidales bacterium]
MGNRKLESFLRNNSKMSKHYTNFIFSSYGYALGKYKITNKQISDAIEQGYITGFDSSRISDSDNYKEFEKNNLGVSPFEFMATKMMGFSNRYHVVPFPPVKKNYKSADNSLNLCVKAVDMAFSGSNIHPENIDAWMVSTATPHEQAPGVSATLKAYFTKYENQSQTITLTSACVGFNINVERAILFLKNNPNAKHVVVAHTEVMSELLLNENDFVPYTTFGDGAAAVIISKVVGEKKEGIVKVCNYEDLYMIDFLGANREGNLYMEPRMVKRRAVPNMTKVANELMQFTDWKNDDVDIFIPHQTGNAIVHNVIKNLEFPLDKTFQEVQFNYGNLSGASVPVALCLLHERGMLKEGKKILTSVAGLGGEFGGFAYIVPRKYKFKKHKKDLENCKVLVTGATGALGSAIAIQLAQKGANIVLQYNNSVDKLDDLLNQLKNFDVSVEYIKLDFSNPENVKQQAQKLVENNTIFDFIVHTAAVTGPVKRASEISSADFQFVYNVNYLSAANLSEVLLNNVRRSILFTGSVAQDAQFPGSSAYVASKKALFKYVQKFAEKAYNVGIRCVFYMPGIIDGGMANYLSNEQIIAGLQQIDQRNRVLPEEMAERMVQSLYLPKVKLVRNSYNGKLQICKDGYNNY